MGLSNVMNSISDLTAHYSSLFGPVGWGPVQCRFALLETAPPEELVSNINIVPFVGDQAVLIELENDGLEPVGGTLEPGETYQQTVERELMEEAGGRLLSLELFGVWHCHSSAPAPFRPHIPHPDFCRLVAYGDVEIVAQPQTLEGAERVRHVHVLPVEEAADRFRAHGRAELAELYLLAKRIRDDGR